MNSLAAYFIGVAIKHHGDFDDCDPSAAAEAEMPDSYAPPQPQDEQAERLASTKYRPTVERGDETMTPAQAVKPPAPSKMTLANVKRGKALSAWRMLVYGVEGIGKTTLAAGTPSPIFLGAEDGTGHLDVVRFPSPESWTDVRAAVQTLLTEQHEYKTLVLDTVDWVEPLIWAHICKRDGEANVESYGYGKGYQVALDEWRLLLAQLERLRGVGVNVMLLAHTHIKAFKNPEGEDFDRYELKLNLKAGGLLKEWADAVLFANHETFAKTSEKTKKVKGISTGARWLYTQRCAAFDAKNRFGFPELLPLSWPDVEGAMTAAGDTTALVEEIRRKVEGLDAKDKETAVAAIARAAGDKSKLEQLNTWTNSKITLKAEMAGKQA